MVGGKLVGDFAMNIGRPALLAGTIVLVGGACGLDGTRFASWQRHANGLC